MVIGRSAVSTADTSPVNRRHPVKRSTNSMLTVADLDAMSAAMMDPSPGVMVMSPSAPGWSTPTEEHRDFLGLRITWASVTCLPGTYSRVPRKFPEEPRSSPASSL